MPKGLSRPKKLNPFVKRSMLLWRNTASASIQKRLVVLPNCSCVCQPWEVSDSNASNICFSLSSSETPLLTLSSWKCLRTPAPKPKIHKKGEKEKRQTTPQPSNFTLADKLGHCSIVCMLPQGRLFLRNTFVLILFEYLSLWFIPISSALPSHHCPPLFVLSVQTLLSCLHPQQKKKN